MAEIWEVSDVDGSGADVVEGPLAGASLRDLTREHPGELVGEGRSGERFALLTELIDAAGTLPVHLPGDDAAAHAEGEPHDGGPGTSVGRLRGRPPCAACEPGWMPRSCAGR